MIEVRIGTTDALEVREDSQGNQQVHNVSGERITEFLIPDGVSPMDAATQVIGSLHGVLMDIGGRPWWVESSSETVRSILKEHYGCPLDKMPAKWGDGTTTTTKDGGAES